MHGIHEATGRSNLRLQMGTIKKQTKELEKQISEKDAELAKL